MLLRDPVHGLVAFDGAAERVLAPLLRAREVQRLRRVRQLGLTSLVFPGAEHSRFAHAVGTAHVMVRLLARLARVEGALPIEQRIDDESGMDAIAAALLHDIGHGPFSHLFEEVLPGARHHEEWSVDIVSDPRTEVHAALEGLSAGMSQRVAALITGRHRIPYLARSVAGTLDVDRCDYLLRDSHMTGVRYGLYDLDWLLEALTLAEHTSASGGATWVLALEGRKGLPPFEGFVLARHFMYQQVYHHKSTRGAECLVRGIFRRVVELVQSGDVPREAPLAIVRAARGERVALDDYLELDDARLLTCFQAWETGADTVLADLSRRFSTRALPKTIPLDETTSDEATWERARVIATDVVGAMGLRPDLHVWLDRATDVPYSEPDDDASEGMFVALRHRPLRRLGDVSFLLGELRNKRYDRHRLVFPFEARDRVVAALEEVLS